MNSSTSLSYKNSEPEQFISVHYMYSNTHVITALS